MPPIKVSAVKCTCPSTPSQWQGRTKDGRTVYARYRSHRFAVGVGRTLSDAVACSSDCPLVELTIDGGDGGTMSYDRLKELTQGTVRWPEVCP